MQFEHHSLHILEADEGEIVKTGLVPPTCLQECWAAVAEFATKFPAYKVAVRAMLIAEGEARASSAVGGKKPAAGMCSWWQSLGTGFQDSMHLETLLSSVRPAAQVLSNDFSCGCLQARVQQHHLQTLRPLYQVPAKWL
jgi:hypothetical protein